VAYAQPAEPKPGAKDKADVEVVDGRETIPGLVDNLANDPKSRDGIPPQLFPLSAADLQYYEFKLKGETTVKGRRAFDITFTPVVRKGFCVDVDEAGNAGTRAEHICRPWKGEAWIDAEDYQPVRIDTELAKGVPWAIRVFMGINLRQLGFSLNYQRVAEGIWFPATYGTEFHFAVFWGYKRTVTLAMENTDFRKTDAQSTVTFDTPQ